MARRSRLCAVLMTFLGGAAAPSAFAVFLDGQGHYALRGKTYTTPGMSDKSGLYQATEQSFRLEGEARMNEASSFIVEMRLFDEGTPAYLGDTPRPPNCTAMRGETQHDCTGRHQDTTLPGYAPYLPRITKAYAQYAFDYCLLSAGRRDRQWGMGIFLDNGQKPFAERSSTFDGVTCDVNLQKTQNLGFSVGVDKLAETGTWAYDPRTNPQDNTPVVVARKFGPNDKHDDLDQFFFTISYDDRQGGGGLTKQIGLYFANIVGSPVGSGGSSTDVKFLDLYTAFYIRDLVFRNEVLFRMGRSADPNYWALGGATHGDDGAAINRVQSIGLAGSVEWTLAHSGAAIGPAEYRQGNAARHVLLAEYAYAPGDSNGYHNTGPGGQAIGADGKIVDAMATDKRDHHAKAMAFHPNFKPALIFFNEHAAPSSLRQDGIFDPDRVMNASVLGFGYRYESFEAGNFESKLVMARLVETVPSTVHDFYEKVGGTRPMGYYGNSLGYELDLDYNLPIRNELKIGVSGALAMPGKAWQTEAGQVPQVNPFKHGLVQGYATFNF